MAAWIDAEQVLNLLAPGQRVYVGGSSNEPQSLLDAIEEAPACAHEVTFVQQPLAVNRRDLSGIHRTALQETFFMTPALMAGYQHGGVHFIPMQMRTIFDYLRDTRMDVALLGAARDAEGNIRYGPNVDYLEAALTAARCKVVEVSDAYLAPLGAPRVDEQQIDFLVSTSTPALEYPLARPDETAVSIGRHIASLIADGDCLQTGIGSVPSAMLEALREKNDLGFHGGLIDDSVMALVQNGNINGSRKSLDRGQHITGMALGSKALLNWLAETASVSFRSANYTHEFSVIRDLAQFISINSAMEVDLFGQVNAEMAGGRQISGTGGSVDFMRAARAAKGGRSVVAMSATAKGGRLSRIVAKVEVATALRSDVDLVVTEFGVADIRNMPVAERMRRLIAIAHPDFRDELEEAALRLSNSNTIDTR